MTSGATLLISEVSIDGMLQSDRGRFRAPPCVDRRSPRENPVAETAAVVDPPDLDPPTVDRIPPADASTIVFHADVGTFTDSIGIADPDDPVAYTIVAAPAYGHLTLFTDGTYTYVPDDDFWSNGGSDTFTVRVCDYSTLRSGSLASRFSQIFGGDGDHTSIARITVRLPESPPG